MFDFITGVFTAIVTVVTTIVSVVTGGIVDLTPDNDSPSIHSEPYDPGKDFSPEDWNSKPPPKPKPAPKPPKPDDPAIVVTTATGIEVHWGDVIRIQNKDGVAKFCHAGLFGYNKDKTGYLVVAGDCAANVYKDENASVQSMFNYVAEPLYLSIGNVEATAKIKGRPFALINLGKTTQWVTDAVERPFDQVGPDRFGCHSGTTTLFECGKISNSFTINLPGSQAGDVVYIPHQSGDTEYVDVAGMLGDNSGQIIKTSDIKKAFGSHLSALTNRSLGIINSNKPNAPLDRNKD